MIERPLMTADELKAMPKGEFVVMKTGTHPTRTRLRLFLDWDITFGAPCVMEEKALRPVTYASKDEMEEELLRRHYSVVDIDDDDDDDEPPPAKQGGAQMLRMDKARRGQSHKPIRTP